VKGGDYLDKMVTCKYCKKKILKGERRVHWTEDIDGKIDLDISFHSKCWIQHYNLSLDKKVKDYANKMMAEIKPRMQHEMEARGMLR
jgi:hypothetical protein